MADNVFSGILDGLMAGQQRRDMLHQQLAESVIRNRQMGQEDTRIGLEKEGQAERKRQFAYGQQQDAIQNKLAQGNFDLNKTRTNAELGFEQQRIQQTAQTEKDRDAKGKEQDYRMLLSTLITQGLPERDAAIVAGKALKGIPTPQETVAPALQHLLKSMGSGVSLKQIGQYLHDPTTEPLPKVAAGIANTDARTQVQTMMAGVEESRQQLEQAQSNLAKIHGTAAQHEDARKQELLPLEMRLKELEGTAKAAQTQEEVARTAFLHTQADHLRAETAKIRQAMKLSDQENAMISTLSSKTGVNLRGYYGKNKGSILKLSDDLRKDFFRAADEAEKVRKERDALSSRISTTTKEYAHWQGLLTQAAAMGGNGFAKDGNKQYSELELVHKVNDLGRQKNTLVEDAKTLGAHLQEMEDIRLDAKTRYDKMNAALKETGSIDTTPGSVKTAFPSVVLRDGTRLAPGMSQEEVARHNGLPKQGPTIHSPEHRTGQKTTQKPTVRKAQGRKPLHKMTDAELWQQLGK